MSNNNKTIVVQGTSVSELANGTRVLVVTTMASPVELQFTPEAWEKLAGSARWFNKHVTVINPKEND